jgi:hypothetical protein
LRSTHRTRLPPVALVIGNNAYENVPQLQKAVNDAADPNGVPEGATLDMKVPPKTASMQVELTYVDGTRSPTRIFNAAK